MRNDGAAEVQHYVPQMLLRFHANEKSTKKGSEQVWCLDKKTDKVFSPNIKRILAETNFNEIEVDGRVLSLEPHLTDIENRTAPLIERIVRTGSVSWIGDRERFMMSAFLAVQFARTATFREDIRQLREGLETVVRQHGFDPSAMKGGSLYDGESDNRMMAFEFVARAPAELAPYFAAKHWCLLAATPDDPFHLGDHPVVRDNDFNPAFGLGLACRGLSIYFPLTPALCLYLLDQEQARELRKSHREGARLAKRSRLESKRAKDIRVKVMIGAELSNLDRLQEQLDERILPMLRGHKPIPYDDQSVMRVNSLQMRFATRWVLSSRNDFTLPRRMISDNEAYRRGVAVRVG